MSNVTSEDILKLSGGGKCLSGGTTPISLDNEDMAGGITKVINSFCGRSLQWSNEVTFKGGMG